MSRKQKRSLKFLLTLIIGIAIFNIFTIAPTNTPQVSNQIKGVWLTHVGNSLLAYTGSVDNVFHRLSKQNFNTVYVDVYNGGTTYYSQYSPRNKLVSLPLTDPLKTAIKQGKRQGLNIYAWYEHGIMVFPNQKIVKQHPDWILTTADGQQYIEKHLWLNPQHPEVRQYFVNLFTEVATKYPDLYGIQLDDHWGIPIIFGNKTQAMTDLTRQVSNAIRKVNSNLILSISPNPYSFSLKKYSLDWMKWIKENLFDEIVIQIYRSNSNSLYQSLVTSGIKEANNYAKVAVGIYAGGDTELKSFSEIEKQISVVKKFGYGYSLFSWEYTSNTLRKAIYIARVIYDFIIYIAQL